MAVGESCRQEISSLFGLDIPAELFTNEMAQQVLGRMNARDAATSISAQIAAAITTPSTVGPVPFQPTLDTSVPGTPGIPTTTSGTSLPASAPATLTVLGQEMDTRLVQQMVAAYGHKWLNGTGVAALQAAGLEVPPDVGRPRTSPFPGTPTEFITAPATASIGGMDGPGGPHGAVTANGALAADAIAANEAALGGQFADNPSPLGTPDTTTAAGQLAGGLGGLGTAVSGDISGSESSDSVGHGAIGDSLGGSDSGPSGDSVGSADSGGSVASGGDSDSSGGDAGGFLAGGRFVVTGRGGPDSTLVQFAGTPGERVIVVPPGRSISDIMRRKPRTPPTMAQAVLALRR